MYVNNAYETCIITTLLDYGYGGRLCSFDVIHCDRLRALSTEPSRFLFPLS